LEISEFLTLGSIFNRRDRNRRAKRDRERVNAKLATWERDG
jgi:hypothetical protein